ncbi:MAG: lipoyl(octanoyl) transferase LipB [Cyclobacteriaceae bacterium]
MPSVVTKNKQVEFIHLGQKPYMEAWDFQKSIFWKTVEQKMANRKLPIEKQIPTKNYLIFCSHSNVYTIGNSGDEKNLLLDEVGLEKHHVEFVHTNRGGDITYHGPGQIVGYPIFDLDHFFTDIDKYLRSLEEAVIRTLEEYGIKAGRIKGLTGVWLDEEEPDKARKICAFGVRSSRWVTMHGFAFNVNTNLSYFGHIIPCGIDDKAVTSLQKELGREIDIAEVEDTLKKHLADIFEFEFV